MIDENSLLILHQINTKLDEIYNLKTNARTSTKVFDNQQIVISANDDSPDSHYSSIINLSDIYVTNISIYGRFILDSLPQEGDTIQIKIIVEYSPEPDDDISHWFETSYSYLTTITSSSFTQNNFNINIIGCAAKYIRLGVIADTALTITGYIDTN